MMELILILLLALVPTILIELGVLVLLREKSKKVLGASVVINILTNLPLNLYVYYVYESVPEYYNVSYTVDPDSASVKMTNTIWLLPDTGGIGTTIFVILGIALLISGTLMAAAFWINWKKGGPSKRRERR